MQDDWILSSRVAPFGNLRVTGYLLLTVAYRSLSRPSSAPDAKAFPLRSFQLDLSNHLLILKVELCRQFNRIFEIVIVTHLYDVPQLKYTLLCLFRHRTSLLPYFTLLLHCSVFKVHYPITFAIRFEDPTFQSGLQIQQQTLFGGPEWARTTDLAIISRTL